MSKARTAFGSLEWRNIGPHRGGRVVAVAAHPTRPQEFYFGATGGGVWKTRNGGMTWQNVSDGFFKTSSVGAIAVATADPNTIYVGTGETSIRGNVSRGDGIYKSTDGGKTWAHLGLAATRHIGRIRVHPTNPDLVYVAALGHAFGPNPERGIYRSADGGKQWQQILFRSDKAGAMDLSMDPTNPRILYASFWEGQRYPHALNSGGPDSSIYKSTDGGDTWTDISRNEGLPKGTLGKIGIAVSPANPDRVWAMVEAEDGGLYRSENGGETWKLVSDSRDLRSRAWYYTHLFAHPTDANTCFVLNNFFWKSTDGGATFTPVATPHPDNHDLWIDPTDPERMITGNDGGACVSFDGGYSWSSIYNQPTGEFYHVTTDSRFPYRVYGAQQDNTTLSVPSRTIHAAITARDWYNVGGAESGYIAVRQDNPDIIFAGSSGGGEGGRISRYDHATGQVREVAVWPEKTAGLASSEYKYRFQWTSPILLSPHDQNVLYSCGNRVFRSTDEGESWTCISPDLTRNDPEKLGPSGGPITKDHTGVEVYCTVFAFAESPQQKGLLWAGSDDGLVHISRDNGTSWQNVTPAGLPEWALISIIEPSPHDPAVAYLAATRYKLDDFQPYLYKTADYGQTWTEITTGIPADDFTRVIREDPERQGLLFAGTESGIYVSFGDGNQWEPLQLNLPVVPVHDLVIKENDLVVATHGRAFWILDDITPLRALAQHAVTGPAHLFAPRDTVRFHSGPFVMVAPGQAMERPFAAIELPGGMSHYLKTPGKDGRAPAYADAGQNPPGGVLVNFWLAEKPKDDTDVKLSFLDEQGTVVATYATKAEDDAFKLKVTEGPNRFIWNMEYPGAEKLSDPAYKRGYDVAPFAPPGAYSVRLEIAGADTTWQQRFRLLPDPRSKATAADLQEQFALACKVRDRISDIHRAVKQIRTVREQVEGWVARSKDAKAADKIREMAEPLGKRLSSVEGELIQVKWQSSQDELNFPPKLNAKVAHLARIVGAGDFRPTRQTEQLFDELSAQVDQQLDQLHTLLETEVRSFTETVRTADLPLVSWKSQ
ncbi:MAG: glycosyl hydrolase repeat-containing protein [Firmicutes bacterium]|nr:glycosyl hydrolase repeat-containing protein [Bacillota bacterium]